MQDNDRYSPAVPDYSHYTAKRTEQGSRTFSYFVVGSMGLLTAAGAKSVVSDFIANLTASADVLALAKVEVDLTSIPEGKNVIIKVCCSSSGCQVMGELIAILNPVAWKASLCPT